MANNKTTTSIKYSKLKENYLKQELYDLVKEDEKVFNFIKDNVFGDVWFWDLDNPEDEFISDELSAALGYDPKEMIQNMTAWENIINKEDLKIAISNFVKHIQDPNFPYDQVIRYKHKFGHIVWIRCKGLAIRDSDNKPTCMIGIHTDITDLKKTEENSQKQIEHYKYIIDGTNLGVWEWNMRTGETMFNERWANIRGYSLSELQPVSIDTWINSIHPTDYAKSNELLQKHLRGEIPDYECEIRLKHKNGEWIWVLAKGKVVSSDIIDTPEWIVGSFIEITESKKALEKNRLFVNQAPSAIAMLDVNMRYLATSQKWLEDYDITDKNIIGKSHYEIFPHLETRTKKDHQDCLKGVTLHKD